MKRKNGPRLLIMGLILLLVVGVVSVLLRLPIMHGSQVGISMTPVASATVGVGTASQLYIRPHIAARTGVTPSPTARSAPKPTVITTATSSSGPWSLEYSDDFNGTQLSSTWGVYNGPHVGGQSYYSPSEVQVQNGLLQIWMEKKTTGGMPYTTGGLAAFRLAQVYGKYEFRVKLPLGKGVGPYAILWPNAPAPNTAQVDIFESPPPTKNELFFTNHGVHGVSTQLTAMGSFAAGFHILTCEWSPGRLQFLVDGVSEGTLTQDVPTMAMWFGIAISTGDAFTGLPDNSTVLPVAMQVDWVHIYRYTG